MPWKENTLMSMRQMFIEKATAADANLSDICREFGISRKTGYKWIARYRSGEPTSLEDRPRRPHHSPTTTDEAIVASILALRDKHPQWGPRKLRRRLIDLGASAQRLPALSTFAAILKRSGCVDAHESVKHQPYQRFERASPNELWQMDFKGDFLLGCGQRCYPLTVLDDHSRFNLVLRSSKNMQTQTVQTALTHAFVEYGLPEQMLMDNGAPWGHDRQHRHTPLTVWLMRLGIAISHGRPYHPQTQGKEERFHRTLKEELLNHSMFFDHAEAETAFVQWRHCYNTERPHQALDLDVPSSRYHTSQRLFPESLPEISYGTQYQVRRVQDKGKISFRGHCLHVGHGFIGYPVGLLESTADGVWQVYFCQFIVAEIDLRSINRH